MQHKLVACLFTTPKMSLENANQIALYRENAIFKKMELSENAFNRKCYLKFSLRKRL